MPGESIGDAYVRVHASGDNIGDSIREDVDGAGRDMERSGEEHGGLYRRGWAKELDLFRDDLHKSLDENMTDFSRGLDRNRVALTGADSRVEQLRRSLRGLVDDQEASRRSMEQFGHRLRISMIGMDDDTRSLADRVRDLTRNTNDWRDSTNETTDRLEFMRGTINALSGSVRFLGRHIGNIGSARAFRNTLNRMGDDADRNSRLFGRMTNSINGFSDVVGAGFGRGSRNNFINFIGSMARGLVRLVALAPKAVDAVATFASEVGKRMAKASADAGGGVEGLIAAIVALSEELLALGPVGIAAAIAGIALLTVTIVPLIGLLSVLAGLITAVAGSITLGLIGALAPLVGLLLPIAAAVGVAALAYRGLANDQEKFVKNLEPFMKALQKLRVIAGKNVMGPLQDAIKGLGPVVKTLTPLVDEVSKSLGRMITSIGESVKGPGFRDFIANMSNFIPAVLDRLAIIIGNTFQGLGGLFIALEPVVFQFLAWLQDLTREFSDFANSATGRHELQDFFENAWESAQALGNLIRSVTGFLGELFSSGQKQGDSLLNSLSKNVDKFREWMRSAEGKRSLKQWFDDAREFGRQLGNAVVAAGKLFRAIDSPEARHAVTTLIRVGGAMFTIGAAAFKVLGQLNAWSRDVIHLLSGPVSAAFRGLSRVASTVTGAIGAAFRFMWNNVIAPAVRGLLNGFASVADGFGSMLGALSHVPGFGWAKDAANAMHGAADKARELAGAINDIHDKSVTVSTHYIATHTTIYEATLDHAHKRGYVPPSSGAPSANSGVTAPSASLAGGKTINNTFNVTSPNDAATVATELLNQMVASAY